MQLRLTFRNLEVNELVKNEESDRFGTASTFAFDSLITTYWCADMVNDECVVHYVDPEKAYHRIMIYSIVSGPKSSFDYFLGSRRGSSVGSTGVPPSSWRLEGKSRTGDWVDLDIRISVYYEKPLQVRSFGIAKSRQMIECNEYRFIFFAGAPIRIDDQLSDQALATNLHRIVAGDIFLYFDRSEYCQSGCSVTLDPDERIFVPFGVLGDCGSVQFCNGECLLFRDILC
jgi:hypothetical protein